MTSEKKIIIPPALQKGDKIGLVAPARNINREIIIQASSTLQSWGYQVVFGANLFQEKNQFSGSDAERAADIQEFIVDSKIKAILCVRGGYGCVRLLSHLNFSPLKSSPKWLIGYSDVTVFHSYLHQLGISSLHATMPINFPRNSAKSLQTLQEALAGKKLCHRFKTHPLNKAGKAKGALVGGNLSVLYSLLGSDSSINTAGKILFLEDLDEYLYHIDRMMMNLKRNGILVELAGLVVGSMSQMHDNDIPFGKTAEEIIYEAVKEYDYPLCFGLPAGHISNNQALCLGQTHYLQVDQESCLYSL